MTQVKVLHISRGFEDYVISLANEVSEFADFHMVITESDRWIAKHLSSKVTTYFPGSPRVTNVKNIKSLLQIRRYIKRFNPDIIHMQNGVIWEGLLPLIFPEITFITTIHDVTIHPNRGGTRFTPQFLLDALTRLSTGIIIHGEKLREAAIYRHGHHLKKSIQVINHPIITRYGSSRDRSENLYRVLFFGTLDEWKGIEYLLAAMEIVSEVIPNVSLKIAGGSGTPEYYQNLPYNGNNIHWDIRRQSEADVKNLFEWADILVLPYIEASQSGVLHIAQSFCLPVVATRTGALQESIIDGKSGLLVQPKSKSALAEAIVKLLTDNELRASIVENMKTYRETTLREKSVGSSTFNYYKKILADIK